MILAIKLEGYGFDGLVAVSCYKVIQRTVHIPTHVFQTLSPTNSPLYTLLQCIQVAAPQNDLSGIRFCWNECFDLHGKFSFSVEQNQHEAWFWVSNVVFNHYFKWFVWVGSCCAYTDYCAAVLWQMYIYLLFSTVSMMMNESSLSKNTWSAINSFSCCYLNIKCR